MPSLTGMSIEPREDAERRFSPEENHEIAQKMDV
jgi:hypothetical protein